MDLDKDRVQGGEAQSILDSSIFKDAWKAAEDGLRNQRLKTAIKDSDMHSRLIIAEQVLDTVRKHIETVIQTGKLADIQLQQKPRFSIMGR